MTGWRRIGWALLLAGVLTACSEDEVAAPDDPDPPVETAEADDTVGPPEPLELVPETLPDVRQVIPGRAVHVPEAGAVVERLPAPPAPVEPPRPVRLGIVQVESANRLSTRRGMVQLEGVEPIAEDATCALADGRTPACHVLARTAVRRFVGRRAVSCTLGLREDAALDHRALCTIGDTNLGLWVIAQGWGFAGADADELMQAAETTARNEQRGLWASLQRNTRTERDQ